MQRKNWLIFFFDYRHSEIVIYSSDPNQFCLIVWKLYIGVFHSFFQHLGQFLWGSSATSFVKISNQLVTCMRVNFLWKKILTIFESLPFESAFHAKFLFKASQPITTFIYGILKNIKQSTTAIINFEAK